MPKLLKKLDKDYWTNELLTDIVQKNGYALKYIDEEFQTEEMCLGAGKIVNQLSYWYIDADDTNIIEHIAPKYRTTRVLTNIIKQNPEQIRFCRKQTKELAEISIKDDGRNIRFIMGSLRTPELCKMAVEQNFHALQHCGKKKTKELCDIGFNKSVHALPFIPKKWITDDMIKSGLERNFAGVVYYLEDKDITDDMLYTYMVESSFMLYSSCTIRKRLTYDMYVRILKSYFDNQPEKRLSKGQVNLITDGIKNEVMRERIRGQIINGKFEKTVIWTQQIPFKYN